MATIPFVRTSILNALMATIFLTVATDSEAMVGLLGLTSEARILMADLSFLTVVPEVAIKTILMPTHSSSSSQGRNFLVVANLYRSPAETQTSHLRRRTKLGNETQMAMGTEILSGQPVTDFNAVLLVLEHTNRMLKNSQRKMKPQTSKNSTTPTKMRSTRMHCSKDLRGRKAMILQRRKAVLRIHNWKELLIPWKRISLRSRCSRIVAATAVQIFNPTISSTSTYVPTARTSNLSPYFLARNLFLLARPQKSLERMLASLDLTKNLPRLQKHRRSMLPKSSTPTLPMLPPMATLSEVTGS